MPTPFKRWRKRWAIPALLFAAFAGLCLYGDLRQRLLKVPPDGPLIAVQAGGKWGFVAANGAVAIPFVWDYAAHFHNETAYVERDGGPRLIARDGAPAAGSDRLLDDLPVKRSTCVLRKPSLATADGWAPSWTLFGNGTDAARRQVKGCAVDRVPTIAFERDIESSDRLAPASPSWAVHLSRHGEVTLASAPIHPVLEHPRFGIVVRAIGAEDWQVFADLQGVFDAEGRCVWRSDFHILRPILLPAAGALATLAALCLWRARRKAAAAAHADRMP